MVEPVDAPASRPRWRDGVGLALLAGLGYVLLWQRTLYETDGHFILVRLAQDEVIYNNHFLYMPLLLGLREALAPLGLPARAVALLLSSLGIAVGVLFAHAACRTAGLSRGPSAWATALVAATAPVVFFATVIEFHGPFFAFAQLAFWAAVALARRPGVGRAALLGLAGAVAFTVHTSALVLPALGVTWFVATRLDVERALRGVDLALAALALAVHFAAVYGALAGLQVLGFPEFPPSYDRGRLLGVSWSAIARTSEIFWQEWGGPYLPVSLLAFVAALTPGLVWRGLALVIGLTAFLVPCVVLLPDRPERGAYMLPLVMPAVLLVAHWVRGRAGAMALLIFLSLGWAWLGRAAHDTDGPFYRDFVGGIEELRAGAPAVVLIAEERELGALLVERPEMTRRLLTELAVQPPAVVAPQLPHLAALLLRPEWNAGRVVYLSAAAEAYLRDPELRPSGPILVEALRAQCRFEEVAAGAFRGYRLWPKP